MTVAVVAAAAALDLKQNQMNQMEVVTWSQSVIWLFVATTR